MKMVTKEFVRELIDFAPASYQGKGGFADTQLEGTVALFNMLQRNRCAYLADEVGMGKTYVALGVMGLFRYFNPHARIVVITPRENIQRKWIKELENFVRLNWQISGNRVKSIQGTPDWEPVLSNSLLSFVHEILLNADRDFFLRSTSFSLSINDENLRENFRNKFKSMVRWIDMRPLATGTPETFRDAVGTIINALVPQIDLLVVDEAHNLKQGFSEYGSIRNRIMGLTFGHHKGKSNMHPFYSPRVNNILLLSATPFDENYGAIYRQFDLFGFGNVKLRGINNHGNFPITNLSNPMLSDEKKREIMEKLMVRRVSALRINGKDYTKNMYRREWRKGGYTLHDEPIQMDNPKERLVVALMQKKVAEILQDEKLNNHFQIGMLSSFESFLQSVSKSGKRKKDPANADEKTEPMFDGKNQNDKALTIEKQGIDTKAIESIVNSYRKRFGRSLPHPKLDRTAQALENIFETGEKTLVFVRRVATVNELASKVEYSFDHWIRNRMEKALPELCDKIKVLFKRYERERMRRPDEVLEEISQDNMEQEQEELEEDRRYLDEEDEGSMETFFSWFYRGKGPSGCLSGAAFQRNRLSSTSSVYATLFEDDYVSMLLNRPTDVFGELVNILNTNKKKLAQELLNRAYGYFRNRSQRKEKFPKLNIYESYQIACLECLRRKGGKIGDKANIIIEERFPIRTDQTTDAPPGFPQPKEMIGIATFFTELTKSPGLCSRIFPEDNIRDFRESFRKREQRRELISAICRLGASYIDLYLLAIKMIGSFTLGSQAEVKNPDVHLIKAYINLLETQMHSSGFHSFYELASAAETFDILISVNFPKVPSAPLCEIAGIYGVTLQKQTPVGRMAGGVNKQLVRQFRMPGFPLALISTDVLQEGEDLHTFCRNVVHYGIAWTPSALEQRTGRVDRIGSLLQRHYDNANTPPTEEEMIQVHYPHLRDTVEVLQIQRVLSRLNRFIKLIHKTKGDSEHKDTRVNVSRELLDGLKEIPPVMEPLESAFPVKKDWMNGILGKDAVIKPDLESKFKHLEFLWNQLIIDYQIESTGSEKQKKEGEASLQNFSLFDRTAEEDSNITKQSFTLRLRSQTSGDATLLRCISIVGHLNLRNNSNIDRLYKLQIELGQPKICIWPDMRKHEDLISIEGGILFHKRTTQIDEMAELVKRTVYAAAKIKDVVILNNEK